MSDINSCDILSDLELKFKGVEKGTKIVCWDNPKYKFHCLFDRVEGNKVWSQAQRGLCTAMFWDNAEIYKEGYEKTKTFYVTFGKNHVSMSGLKLENCYIALKAKSFTEAKQKIYKYRENNYSFIYSDSMYTDVIKKYGLKEISFEDCI